MMTLEILLALITFVFIGSVTPGPNNLMLLASGINFGVIKTIPHLLGINIGHVVMVFLIGMGLMPIFETFPVTYLILKVVSIVYLTYLAWKILTAGSLNDTGNGRAKPMTFMQAALFQWVNPKAWVMAVTAMSVYASSAQSFYNILFIVLVYVLVMMPAITVWVVLGTQLKRFLNNAKKVKIFNVMTALLLMLSLVPTFF